MKYILFILFSLISINLISSIQVGNQGIEGVNFKYSTPINYTTIPVLWNDSIHWQGYTPSSYNTTFINGYYYPSTNPSNFINSSFNSTYNTLLNQNCNMGFVVNGTFSNGTIKCINLTFAGSSAFWTTGTNQNVGVSNKTGTITFNDNTGKISADINDRILYDTSNIQSLVWRLRYTLDSSGRLSLSWNNRNLYNTAGNTVYDWESGEFYDTSSIISIDQQSRQTYNNVGNEQFDWASQNGTYLFKNVNIRGDVARLDDTALFVQSPDRVDSCVGDITTCSDLSVSSPCDLFSGCYIGECQGTLDCTMLNEDYTNCNYLETTYGNCQTDETYYNYCNNIGNEYTCGQASYDCFWNNPICDATSSSYTSCSSFSNQNDCEADGCYWDGSACTKQVNDNIFTSCSTVGSCSGITQQGDCAIAGCTTWDTSTCLGTPSSTSCSQIQWDGGYCEVGYTNGYCSIATANDLTTHIDKVGVGQTKNAYECQDTTATAQTSISNDCTTLTSQILNSTSVVTTSIATNDIQTYSLTATGTISSNYDLLISGTIRPSSNNAITFGWTDRWWVRSYISTMHSRDINTTTLNATTVKIVNLNVTGNATFINITARNICYSNGTNCTSSTSNINGTNINVLTINSTSQTINGNLNVTNQTSLRDTNITGILGINGNATVKFLQTGKTTFLDNYGFYDLTANNALVNLITTSGGAYFATGKMYLGGRFNMTSWNGTAEFTTDEYVYLKGRHLIGDSIHRVPDDNGVDTLQINGSSKMHGNLNVTGIINTQTNFSVKNIQGISGNYTIIKDVDLVGLTKTYCSMNFTGGILYSSTC